MQRAVKPSPLTDADYVALIGANVSAIAVQVFQVVVEDHTRSAAEITAAFDTFITLLHRTRPSAAGTPRTSALTQANPNEAVDDATKQIATVALAKFIYSNGLHNALADTLLLGPYRFQGVREAMRTTGISKNDIYRVISPICYRIHNEVAIAKPLSIFDNHVARYGIDISNLDPLYQFFTADYGTTIPPAQRVEFALIKQAILEQANKNIAISGTAGITAAAPTATEIADARRKWCKDHGVSI